MIGLQWVNLKSEYLLLGWQKPHIMGRGYPQLNEHSNTAKGRNPIKPAIKIHQTVKKYLINVNNNVKN